MLEVKVTKRDSELTKGIFKVGTVIDLDLDDMVVYRGGIEWNVARTDNGFKLPGSETHFAAV